MKRIAVALSLIGLVGGCPSKKKQPDEALPAPPPTGRPGSPVPSTPSPEASASWIGFGAGGHPADYQISIAQDLALAEELLGDGRVLFGSGPAATVGRLRDEGGDALTLALGELLSPRAGRDVEYVPAALDIDGPATREGLESALREGLEKPGAEPLLLYVAGHGDMGPDATRSDGRAFRDNTIAAWFADSYSVAELAAFLARPGIARPLLMVSTTCYGGGFADALLPEPGTSPITHCGVFATTSDLAAVGCDPNPDRRAQEGYALYFWNALRGLGRDGKPAAVDLDGNGTVSVLEAHSQARLMSRSANVPTTTSEQLLWSLELPDGPAPTSSVSSVILPENRAVIDGLRKRLEVAAELSDAELLEQADARLRQLEARYDAADRSVERARLAEERAYRLAGAELLSRWPVLDDPYHPLYAATVTRERDALAKVLESSAEVLAYRQATADAVRVADEQWALRVEAAPWENLWRALETERRATHLASRGGDDWLRYAALLACERARIGRAPVKK